MSLLHAIAHWGRGYLPDPVGHRWNPFALLAASDLDALDLPLEADLAPFAYANAFDQGMTNACVGHATSLAVWTAFCAAGKPLPFCPSPRAIYALARCLGNLDARKPRSVPIEDTGSQPNEAMRAISEWGVEPWGPGAPDGRRSDCYAEIINVKPRLDELATERAYPVVGMYMIDPVNMVDDICRALASRYPVPFAVNADALAYDGQPFGRQAGAPDHYMCFLGYRTVGGSRIFKFRNSWGPQWGVDGYAEADENFVASCSVAYAMQVA